MLVASPLLGQAGGNSLDLEKLVSKPNSTSAALLSGEQVPTDNVVDADIYVVGPGDVLSYITTGFDFTEKLTAITSESSLIIERLGLFDVKGLTLTQVKQLISQRMGSRSGDVEVFITLRRPRLVYVSIQGNVPFPGTYAVPASMRVSAFIDVCRQPWLIRRDASVGELVRSTGGIVPSTKVGQLTRGTYSGLSAFAVRNVVVRHQKGVSLIDIPRSKLDGFAYLDPHLREGDVVTVPFDETVPSTISIGGAVAYSATLAFKEGDKASLLLAAAGGLAADADVERITLVQGSGNGKIALKVNEEFQIVGEDPILQPGSSIIVERKVSAGNSPSQGIVEVFGEVKNPGSFVIVPGTTRLTDVLQSSGGITESAAVSLAYVVRPESSKFSHKDERDEAYRRFMYSDLRLEDTVRFHLDQAYRLPYVSCDFAAAVKNSASADNILLHNGDVIVVPKTPDRVYVYGQVSQPGYVGFQKGKKLEWYVERAGGYAAGAKWRRARIIKGKTKVWVEDDSDVFVEPGDEVYVPRSPDVPAGVEMQTWAMVAGIASSLAGITATIIALLR